VERAGRLAIELVKIKGFRTYDATIDGDATARGASKRTESGVDVEEEAPAAWAPIVSRGVHVGHRGTAYT
jgi:hypothetical protein